AEGLGEVTRADLVPVFGADLGRNIFFVPLSERRAQLEQIPWVERATVMRILPDQIRVSILERRPIAFVRLGQQIRLVDANGVLLNMSAADMAQHHYSFPVLTGIDERDPLLSRKARMAVYQRLMSDLDANGQQNSEQISEIDLTDPEDARVLMPEQGADILVHFGEDHFLERYQRYKAHIAEWRQQYPKLAEVDLRYDQQVVLQMAPGASGEQATAGTVNPKQLSASIATPANVKPAATPKALQEAGQKKAAPLKVPVKRATTTKKQAGHSAVPTTQVSKHAPSKATKARPSESEIEKAAARQRAERERAKKRAAVKRAALNRSKQKSAKTRSAATAGQGQ
ncbi:MAG: FtsQ-type POTRA domain-containing protein, partial [Terracidiphilus sp.]